GYTATYNDANKLHYISKDTTQARAEFGDQESTGKWDFVLNPQSKKVVLGQRVKLTLHANGYPQTPAKFEGVTAGRDDEKGILTKLPSEDKKEDIYDIYATGPKSAILAPEPMRKGYAFTGWYKEPSVSDDAADENKSGKTLVKEQKLVEDTDEITSIIDPNKYELYAGWEKVILVEKVWDDNNDKYGNRPDKVTVKLLSGGALLASPIELNAQNNWKGEFRNIRVPKIFRGYQVKEEPKQYTGYEAGVVTGDDINGFTVKNSTEYITIEGSKTWEHGENPVDKQPTSVTVKLSDGTKEESKTVGANDNWTWTFENLPKYKNKTLVNYTLTEAPVDHYTSTKSEDGYSFTNTFTNKYKVTYEFVSGTTGKTLPAAIEGYKPTDDTEYADKATVTAKAPTQTSYEDTENNGTWTFTSWDADSKTIDKADVKFVGTWTFAATPQTKYKATYEFKSGTEGKALPAAIEGYKPTDDAEYADGATVTAKNPTQTTYNDTDGTWTFTSWDQNSKTIDKADVKFVGTWTFAATPQTKYKATYEFKSGTEGKDLPAAINGYKPTDDTEYDDKATVTTKQPTQTSYEDTENNGTWSFTSWDANSKTVDGADVKFVGTWTFAAKPDPEPESDFSVTKTVDKQTYEKAGDVLTYTVTVKNTGEKKLENLTITDSLVGSDKLGDDTTFNLEVGEEKTFEYTYTVTEVDVTAKKVTNTATVTHGDDSKDDSTTSTLKEDKPDPEPNPEPEPKPEPDPGYWYEPSPPYLREDPKEEPEEPIEEEPIERPELNKDDHKIYMFGYPDWTFKPEGEMTRGEAAAMFARLFKEYPGDNYNYHEDFSDVDENYWCYKEIAYLAEWGIINGYEDGTFKPDNKISRAEFVKIVESFEALQTGTNPYSDVSETYWAYKYIVSSSAKGWINGYLDGTFKPDNNISRSEAVKIANKLVNRHPDKDFIDRNKYLLKDFIDLPTSHWAYYEIHEAANGHIFERLANGMDERWLEVNEERFVFTPPKYHYNK
ncbi:MAG: SHIRT domain-containing protein, partial [Ezakiella massiliensis]